MRDPFLCFADFLCVATHDETVAASVEMTIRRLRETENNDRWRSQCAGWVLRAEWLIAAPHRVQKAAVGSMRLPHALQ